MGGGCWGAPRCGSAPGEKPVPAWPRCVPGRAPSCPRSAAPGAGVCGGTGAWGGCGNSAASHGEGAVEICPGARLSGCCRAPGEEGLPRPPWELRHGQQWTPAWAGAAPLSLSPSPSHPRPQPCGRRQPGGAPALGSPLEPGMGTFIRFFSNLRCNPRAQQLLPGPGKFGSALCLCPLCLYV